MRCLSREGLACLASGAVAITSRVGQAAAISRQFAEYAAASGQKAWQRPVVLTTQAWLNELWKRQRCRETDPAMMLSAVQEETVWHDIIERDNPELIDTAKTARSVRSAALKCAEYHISFSDRRWVQDSDAERFLRWHKEFERRCARENWITAASAWDLLPDWLGSEDRAGKSLLVAGSVERTPALEAGVRSWRARGGEVRWDELPPGAALPYKVCCQTNDEETERAAHWARSLAAAGATSIGVVVPRLEDQSKQVARIFGDICYPGHVLAEIEERGAPDGAYRTSVRQHLSEHPLVAAALLLIDAAADPMRVTDASALLRSPYWKGAKQERHQRAKADLRLRRARSLDVPAETVRAACKDAPTAREFFKELSLFLLRCPRTAEFPYWAKYITELLELAGWPGEALPPCDEAGLDAWQEAIGVLASLGAVSSVVTRGRAIQALRRVLKTRAVRRGGSAPIQVVDLQAAEGMHFDHLWVTGLSPEDWPSARVGVDFVPLSLLRDAGVPGTGAAQRRDESRRVVERLLGSAADLVVSFTGRPLAWLEQIESRDGGALSDAGRARWGSGSFAAAILDQIDDSRAPQLKSPRAGGGTSLIQYQSRCPFRAFAQIRLAAGDMRDGTFGFDPLDRGKFLHGVLAEVWLVLRSQAALKRATDEELKAVVEAAVVKNLGPAHQDSPFDRELAQAEQSRLSDLTLEWLALEKQRLVPFEIALVEEGRTFERNGLVIELRLDRIDRLENGKLLLIDYKSGKRGRKDLDGDRPAEPQMLVYAAALGEEVDGVMFGLANVQDSKLVGYARAKHLKEKECEELGALWPERRAKWEAIVARLAEEFRSGDAPVDPAAGACKFCHLGPLCRIQEAAIADGEGEA